MEVKINLDPQNGPEKLEFSGLKLFVEITTASMEVEKKGKTKNSIKVWALVDTGAYKTHISHKLAEYLDLEILGGKSEIPTSGGPTDSITHTIDIKFIDYDFKPFINLDIESLKKLKFDLTTAIRNPSEKKNHGVLIGRDILSHWNLNWDGPTSTVTISD